MEPLEFLDIVWSGSSGYVFIPQRGSRWVEGRAYKWPQERDEIDKRLRNAQGRDQYYCPNLFNKPERRKEYVQNPKWLYSDLDSVNPKKISLKPTIAIQSSPGRYQALWKLSRSLKPPRHEEINRALTYSTGADRGGWDLTQVLRVPNTQNHKYPGRVTVKLNWYDQSGGIYNLRQVSDFLDTVAANTPGDDTQVPVEDLLVPGDSPSELRKKAWPYLDTRGKYLLGVKQLPEDTGPEGRSGRLWELECLLLEAGLEPEEVFVLTKDSVWNKYEGRHDADLQLWREIQKAHLHIGIQKDTASGSNGPIRTRPRLITYSNLLSSPIREPEWLVEDWWTLSSHGIIAGLPKSYKSLVTLDLAVSIASESDFLGQYPVNPKGTGPVLVVQQENSLPLLRDRLLKISHSRGLQLGSATVEGNNTLVFKLPPSLPLMFYNDFAFDMTMPDDREAIEEVIRAEGVKLVVFDPLYLMIGGADESSAQEMRPILSWLLRLRNLYNCAVVVVHHWGKSSASNRGGRGLGGTRLLGSTTIYGWLEAALYLEANATKSGSIQVVVEREFRERLSPPPSGYDLTMGDIGDNTYGWHKTGSVGTDNRILDTIQKAGPRGASLSFIRGELEIGQKKLRADLDSLIDDGLVEERMEGRHKKVFLR